jgi:hypothetical protein
MIVAHAPPEVWVRPGNGLLWITMLGPGVIRA